jgi:hypothetical protein
MPAIDMDGNEIDFGDEVYWRIWPSSGGYAYVAGEMSYSEKGSRVLLVSEGKIGMPIHAGHCRLASRGHVAKVQPMRETYLKTFPKGLKV